jgi:hypothetical protein
LEFQVLSRRSRRADLLAFLLQTFGGTPPAHRPSMQNKPNFGEPNRLPRGPLCETKPNLGGPGYLGERWSSHVGRLRWKVECAKRTQSARAGTNRRGKPHPTSGVKCAKQTQFPRFRPQDTSGIRRRRAAASSGPGPREFCCTGAWFLVERSMIGWVFSLARRRGVTYLCVESGGRDFASTRRPQQRRNLFRRTGSCRPRRSFHACS